MTLILYFFTPVLKLTYCYGSFPW